MQKLEDAILQQQAAVTETRARAERAREEWQLKQRKVQAYDTLSQRHALTVLRHESRHEQKLQDELASRASHGKLQSQR